MHANCIGLKVVLADGTIIDQMNPHENLPVGYDLKQLFIGSEGTLVSAFTLFLFHFKKMTPLIIYRISVLLFLVASLNIG